MSLQPLFHRVLFALVIALGLGRPILAQQPFFMGLGDLPGGYFFSHPMEISADGSVIMGRSLSGIRADVFGGEELFRWTCETGMVGLGGIDGGQPRLSADGSTIVGSFYPEPCVPCSAKPFRWTTTAGMTLLPADFNVFGVSGDGSIVVGHTPFGYPWKAVRWTEIGGIEKYPFDDLPPAIAVDITADGSIILGHERDNPGAGGEFRYFTWSAADGVNYLGISANHNNLGARISDNGKVVVSGNPGTNPPNPLGAWRWTKETGAVAIGPLPDGKRPRNALGVSADGSIIVGGGESDPINSVSLRTSECCGYGLSSKPFIWDEINGPRYLFDVLRNEYGLGDVLAGWKDVANIAGVSADGRTITGLGVNPDGNGEAWVAYLGTSPDIAGDYNSNSVVDAADYVVWRNAFGQAGAGLAADGNGDGVVNQVDYDLWCANFGQTAGSSGAHEGVPEPASTALGLVAIVAALAMRRRSVRVRVTVPCVVLGIVLATSPTQAGRIVGWSTGAPNNDDYAGLGENNPNFRSYANLTGFALDALLVAQPSGGTTEYSVRITGNFTSAPTETIQLELGFGIGENFVSAATVFPELDFDTPLPGTPPPTSEVFADVNHQPHRIEYSDGLADDVLFGVAMFSIDVPDLPTSVNAHYNPDDLAELAGGVPTGAAVFTLRTVGGTPLVTTLAPPFADEYSITDLGTVAGMSEAGALGGLAMRLSDPQTLLIAGDANEEQGALYAAKVIRDADNHIVGFDGTATRAVDAPFIDGGAQSGPGEVLFLTRYPNNELGQSKPGSQATDKVIPLEPLGIAPSPGALSFVPPGMPGAGQLKIVSYDTGDWYTLELAPDGNGTFDITAARHQTTISGGPQGIAYVPLGSPVFGQTPTVLVAEYNEGAITAFDVDANGDPIPETRREFLTGVADGTWAR